jgi:ketosteroid isomerase-like protein
VSEDGNVELLRTAYDAFERRDLEAVSQSQDPEIEWQTSVEDPDAATHRGRAAVRRYFEGYLETFPGLRAALEECVEAPGDRVLATIRYTGRARASGIDMDWRQWLVYTFKDGLIVRAEEYFGREEALRAAGVRE